MNHSIWIAQKQGRSKDGNDFTDPSVLKMIHLNDEKAKGFYAEHEGRPFFNALVEFMTSGPIVVQVLAGENAITKNRELMGDTNPETANPGTIRSDFAETIDANAVHGSDSPESAAREIAYFFDDSEIVG